MINRDLVEHILIQCALHNEDIAYSELLARLGIPFSRPAVRELCRVLGQIDCEGKQNDAPEFAVLVVRASDRLPGDGWWDSVVSYRGDRVGPKAKQYVKRRQKRVFQFWQSQEH